MDRASRGHSSPRLHESTQSRTPMGPQSHLRPVGVGKGFRAGHRSCTYLPSPVFHSGWVHLTAMSSSSWTAVQVVACKRWPGSAAGRLSLLAAGSRTWVRDCWSVALPSLSPATALRGDLSQRGPLRIELSHGDGPPDRWVRVEDGVVYSTFRPYPCPSLGGPTAAIFLGHTINAAAECELKSLRRFHAPCLAQLLNGHVSSSPVSCPLAASCASHFPGAFPLLLSRLARAIGGNAAAQTIYPQSLI